MFISVLSTQSGLILHELLAWSRFLFLISIHQRFSTQFRSAELAGPSHSNTTVSKPVPGSFGAVSRSKSCWRWNQHLRTGWRIWFSFPAGLGPAHSAKTTSDWLLVKPAGAWWKLAAPGTDCSQSPCWAGEKSQLLRYRRRIFHKPDLLIRSPSLWNWQRQLTVWTWNHVFPVFEGTADTLFLFGLVRFCFQ